MMKKKVFFLCFIALFLLVVSVNMGLFQQILKIRANVEGITIDDESLIELGEIGMKTTLR